MLLRTRITLMAAGGLLLTALGLGGAALLREELLLQRLAATSRAAQTALWAEVLAAEDRVLDQYADKLLLAPHFLHAVRQGDADAITRSIAQTGLEAEPGQPLELAAVLGLGRHPVVHGRAPERALLDTGSLERAVAGDAMDGLRLVGGATQALVLSTRRVPEQSDPVVLALARDVRHALQHMARRTASVVTLLDVRGNLLATTDAALWRSAAEHVAQRAARHGELTLEGRTHTLVSIAVHDLAGHPAGTLITLADATEDTAASRFLGRQALAAIAALLLAVLFGLNFYLRRGLRPLERSIDALQALAQGDASVRLPEGGDDEIGRIARAVAAFRRNAQELATARALRERVRSRQERLLRSKLQHLAEATEQTLTLPTSHDDGEQLRQLAGVMNELSGRLIDQHQRLTGMVQELREALATKTRLAGLEQELQIAAQVQLSILPRQQPQDARVELHCSITPAREVGGDFYDYFFIDDTHLGVVIADVSGKGVPAALFMTITRTLLKATAQFVADPTQCLSQLNDLLAAENEQVMFVTMFYGVLDLDSGEMRYVNAGHNCPYLLGTDGGVSMLPRTGGMAVAVSEGFPYRADSVTLAAGDRLFLYTDGVNEAFDTDGEEYGVPRLERMLHALMAVPDCTPEAIAAGVLADVHAFERGAPQADDITCVVMRYAGNSC